MCENHDGLSHHSIGVQRRLRSPSVDEQETELEPSLEQDEEDMDQEQDQETEEEHDGDVTPSKKKEIMVHQSSWRMFRFFIHSHHVITKEVKKQTDQPCMGTEVLDRQMQGGWWSANFSMCCWIYIY